MDLLTGQYSEEDWRRIMNALETYVITQETNPNMTDAQFSELCKYGSLASDIELFILPIK